MNRRGFLAAILASGIAPAVATSGILMPVRRLILPGDDEWPTLAAGSTVYVNPFRDGGGQFPYNSWQNAARSIAEVQFGPVVEAITFRVMTPLEISSDIEFRNCVFDLTTAKPTDR